MGTFRRPTCSLLEEETDVIGRLSLYKSFRYGSESNLPRCFLMDSLHQNVVIAGNQPFSFPESSCLFERLSAVSKVTPTAGGRDSRANCPGPCGHNTKELQGLQSMEQRTLLCSRELCAPCNHSHGGREIANHPLNPGGRHDAIAIGGENKFAPAVSYAHLYCCLLALGEGSFGT